MVLNLFSIMPLSEYSDVMLENRNEATNIHPQYSYSSSVSFLSFLAFRKFQFHKKFPIPYQLLSCILISMHISKSRIFQSFLFFVVLISISLRIHQK